MGAGEAAADGARLGPVCSTRLCAVSEDTELHSRGRVSSRERWKIHSEVGLRNTTREKREFREETLGPESGGWPREQEDYGNTGETLDADAMAAGSLAHSPCQAPQRQRPTRCSSQDGPPKESERARAWGLAR